MSTSQTQVVRPRWRRRAVAWIVPCTIGRRKLVWLDSALGGHPVLADRLPGGDRGQALGDRGVDPAVDEPGRLLDLVADHDARRRLLLVERQDLEPVEGVEAHHLQGELRLRHGRHTTLSTPAMPLQTLAPDQRAVVQLVLQRERSYAQIAELLSISEDAVRARAHAGLSALAPEVELPADKLAQVADFLLGQQNGKPRQATRRMLRSSNGAREWAETVRAQLVEVSGASVPELPAKAAAKARPRRKPAAEEPCHRPWRRAPYPDRAFRGTPARSDPPAPARARSGTSRGPAPAPARRSASRARRRRGGLLTGRRGGADRRSPCSRSSSSCSCCSSSTATTAKHDRPRGRHADRRPPRAARPRSARSRSTAPAPRPRRRACSRLYLQASSSSFRAPGAGHAADAEGLTRYALWLSGPGSRAKWIGDVPNGRQGRGAPGPGTARGRQDVHAGHRLLPPGPRHRARATERPQKPGRGPCSSAAGDAPRG